MEFERVVVRQPVNGVPVNVLRVGDTLVDTGHMLEPSRPVVESELDGGRLAGIETVVLTHPHSDHIGGSQSIPSLAGLPHVVFTGMPEIMRNFNEYLARVREEITARTKGLEDPSPMAEGYFANGEYYEDDIQIDRVVDDGDTVWMADEPFEVVDTPGHCAHHMSLYHSSSGTLFSGDLITRNGFAYGPLTADIGAYEASLERVRPLEPEILVPGHGPPMDNPLEAIEDTLHTVREFKGAVADGLKEHGALSATDLVDLVFHCDSRNREFLTLIAGEYLLHLADNDSIAVEQTSEGLVGRYQP